MSDDLTKKDVIYLCVLFLIVIFTIIIYKQTRYKVYYTTECSKCVEWVSHDNKRGGKYHRSWQECNRHYYYNCIDFNIYFTFKPHTDSIIVDGITKSIN